MLAEGFRLIPLRKWQYLRKFVVEVDIISQDIKRFNGSVCGEEIVTVRAHVLVVANVDEVVGVLHVDDGDIGCADGFKKDLVGAYGYVGKGDAFPDGAVESESGT